MICELQLIANDPPTYGVMVFEHDDQTAAKFDPYFCTAVAVIQPDGLPMVKLFSPREMTLETCGDVRYAMGVAFRAKGWTHYYRQYPRTGKIVKKPVLGECEKE